MNRKVVKKLSIRQKILMLCQVLQLGSRVMSLSCGWSSHVAMVPLPKSYPGLSPSTTSVAFQLSDRIAILPKNNTIIHYNNNIIIIGLTFLLNRDKPCREAMCIIGRKYA